MDKSQFSIDLDALDIECQNQPDLVYRVCRVLTETKKELADEEKAFKACKEKIAAHARKNPHKYGIMKVTNDAINNAVATHEKVQKFLDSIAALTYNVDLAWNAVNAANSKQTSLTDLVKLHGQSYFDAPRLTEKGVASINKDKARKKGGVKSKE